MKEKRKEERLKDINKITITVISEEDLPKNKTFHDRSDDISPSGVKIQSNIYLPVDTFVKIDLTLTTVHQHITTFGKVRWIKTILKNKSYEAGIQFINTPKRAIKKLQDYSLWGLKFPSINPSGIPLWIFTKFNILKSK
ncbi:MAG: PilZ domain-containing protein [Syntrophaceae bacterium]|nr:PilZ domain-containing protein [Syntrophaceae bacterium]